MTLVQHHPLERVLEGASYNDNDDSAFFGTASPGNSIRNFDDMWDEYFSAPCFAPLPDQTSVLPPNRTEPASQEQISFDSIYQSVDVEMTDADLVATQEFFADEVLQLGQQLMFEDQHVHDNSREKLKVKRARSEKRTRKFVSEQIKPLQTWLNDNTNQPYPGNNTKIQLASQSGLTSKQISHWFTRARQRLHRFRKNCKVDLQHSYQKSEYKQRYRVHDLLQRFAHTKGREFRPDIREKALAGGERSHVCKSRRDQTFSSRLKPLQTRSVPDFTDQVLSSNQRTTLSLNGEIASNNNESRKCFMGLFSRPHRMQSTFSLPYSTSQQSLEVNAASPQSNAELESRSSLDIILGMESLQPSLQAKNLELLGTQKFRIEKWLQGATSSHEVLIDPYPDYTECAEDISDPFALELEFHEFHELGSQFLLPHKTPEMEMENASDCRSAAGSSIGSVESHCSYTSFGSRKGRRLPFAGPKEETVKEGRADSKVIFTCTFCQKVFGQQYTWQRHEESVHIPSAVWVCGPDRVFNKTCPLCDCLKDHGYTLRPCDHRLLSCWQQPEHDRTFYRQDSLKQHLEIKHNWPRLFPSPSHWKKQIKPRSSALICPFCAVVFGAWKARVNHVANHFKKGDRLSRR